MKRIIIAILLTACLTGCGRGENDFDASGRFEATEIIVSAEVGGRITAFDVTEGQPLAAGEQVGSIDTVQLHLKVAQLRAAVAGAESRRTDITRQIAVTQQQIATQQTERRRFEQLVRADAANQKQLDDIDASIALLEKQLAAQRSTMEGANRGLTQDADGLRIQIEQVEEQIARSRIASPAAGTVLAKYAEAGEMAAAGRPLFKVADVQNMYLRAYVTADQLTQLKLGQEVKVYADFGADGLREYEGRISWVSDRAEFTPKTIQTRDERADLVYAMKVEVRNDGYLKIGMYGQLKFGAQ